MPPEVLFVSKKARRNFLQKEIAYHVAREILKFPTICRYIVKNKVIFGPLLIQLVWYILKQLFTSVLVKVMDIYRAALLIIVFQYPELLVASYNNNEDAPHEPDGVALIWNMKYQKESPEYIFHCQVS